MEALIDACTSLISPLGQYHYKGSGPGGWHSTEDGDATYHTSILASALAFSYSAHPGRALPALQSIMGYYERMLNARGCIGRNFVTIDAYQNFIPAEQHCHKGFSLKDEPCMKYQRLDYFGVMFRYDVSLDAISQAMTACYWIMWLVPSLAERARLVVKLQYDYYAKTGWRILDQKDQVCRYGYHIAGLFNPMGVFTKLLMEHILGMPVKLGISAHILNHVFRTFVPGVYLDKRTRKQFNNYMAMQVLHALIHAGFDLNAVMKRLIAETLGEENLYAHAVSNLLYGTQLPTMGPNFSMRKTTSSAYIAGDSVVPFAERSGFNYWEQSAYRRAIYLPVAGLVVSTGSCGQADILQARALARIWRLT